MEQTLGGIYVFVVLFLVVLAILWFILPFAIFGTKSKLDALIVETKKTNTELEKLRGQLSTTLHPNSAPSMKTPSEGKFTHDQLMAKYKISNDGEKYIVQGHRFDRIEDAVAYARKQTPG
jgi:hypothetical protein